MLQSVVVLLSARLGGLLPLGPAQRGQVGEGRAPSLGQIEGSGGRAIRNPQILFALGPLLHGDPPPRADKGAAGEDENPAPCPSIPWLWLPPPATPAEGRAHLQFRPRMGFGLQGLGEQTWGVWGSFHPMHPWVAPEGTGVLTSLVPTGFV